MNKKVVLIVLFVFSLILLSQAFWPDKGEDLGEVLEETFECQIDSDCVPASCCHPTSCVAIENAPSCESLFCTMDCKPGTLDCGRGSCGCVENKCVVKFR